MNETNVKKKMSFSSSRIQSSLTTTGNTSSSLHLSDLNQDPKNSSLSRSIEDNRIHEIEFVESMAASNREIDSLRDEIQVLMTKAHAYCKNTGVSSDTPILPSTPPRYNSFNSFNKSSLY